MLHIWGQNDDLKCVVLCAGQGKRLSPYTDTISKVLNLVGEYPILHHVVNYWQQFAKEFIFIVPSIKSEVSKYAKTLPVKSVCVEQKERRGVANALSYAKPYITGNLILVLGDCFCKGNFSFPHDMDQGVAVWETDDCEAIKQSYSIEYDADGFLSRVEEKPKYLTNKYCGMGYYFFKSNVFDYIQITLPSKVRNEIEITDVIANMITAGEKISVVKYFGDYININTAQDLRRAALVFSHQCKILSYEF
jgi:glucose-1-phosphate thymidylyltransferase